MRLGLRVLLVGAALAAIGEPRAAAQARDDGAELDEAATSKGTLIIRARNASGKSIEDAAVTIDARSMGLLEDGAMTLTNIPAGQHAVVIAAGGYRRFEQAVTVRDGQQRLDALLIEDVQPKRFPTWKWSLGTSIALLATGAAYGYYSTTKMRNNEAAVVTIGAVNPDGTTYDYALPVQTGDCGKSLDTIAQEKHSIVVNPARFDRECTWRARVLIGYGIAGIGLIGAFVSAIVLTRESGSLAPATWSAPGQRPAHTFVPIVGPDGAGALLSFTW